MKFTVAASLLALYHTNGGTGGSSPMVVEAFTPSNLRTSGSSKGTSFHRPSRGNVSYRKKVREWHNLVLEPWAGLGLSASVDELSELDGADVMVWKNGAVDPMISPDAPPSISTSFDSDSDAMAKTATGTPTSDFKEEADFGPSTEASIRQNAKEYLSQYEGQNGAAIVYSKLVEHGVEVVNGYSGGAVLPLLDQFSDGHPRHGGKDPKVAWVTNSNESSAGHVAEGIAKSSIDPKDGKPVAGVVVATSGPGMTNLVTPMQDAICDGVPMIVLCGQAATNAPCDAFQGAPAVEIATPCTKWSYQIKSAAELPYAMDYAFFISRHGRPGPVFIDLPKDLQVQTLTADLIEKHSAEQLEFGTHRDTTELTFRQDHMFDHPPHLVRLRSIDGAGTSTKDNVVMTIGNERRGCLPFRFGHIKDDEGNRLGLLPVPPSEGCDDFYRLDHLPSDRIYDRRPHLEKDLSSSDPTVEDEEVIGAFDSSVMDDLMSLVRYAKKPVLVAGQGCNDCTDELLKFAERLQIPVCTTLHALGAFDERHPLALNMLGMHGHPTPNFMIQGCDLLLCVGSRFDDRITGNPKDFIPEARLAATESRGGVVHVDIRLSEKAKQVEPTFFVHSTAKKFFTEANAHLDRRRSGSGRTRTGPWLEHMKSLQDTFPVRIPTFPTVTGPDGDVRTPMSAQYVVNAMDKALHAADAMDRTLVTTGVGVHQMVTAQLLTWTKPRQMLSSGSLGTMGVALGYCVGAAMANSKKGKLCLAVDGDGSFNMTFTELKTVGERRIPVRIMILDNGAQVMVEVWQKLFFDGRYIAVHNDRNPDYVTLASAFGIRAIRCDRAEDLEEKMKDFLFKDPDQPVLFHVKVESTPCLPLVAPGTALDNMILTDVDDDEVEMDRTAAPS